MKLETGVWSRTGNDTMDLRSFFFLINMLVLLGLGTTAYVANQMTAILYTMDTSAIVLIHIIPFIGIFLAVRGNAFSSFIGYLMIIIPFGAILGPLANVYIQSPGIIENVFSITAGITIAMAIIGVAMPNVFKNLGGMLFAVLLAIVIARIGQLFIPALSVFSIFSVIDYIAAILFSAYIGYDMYRATQVSRTLDSAIDIAISLYLDILNLMITLLRIFSNNESK